VKFGAGLINDRFFVDVFGFFIISQASRLLSSFHYTVPFSVFICCLESHSQFWKCDITVIARLHSRCKIN